MRTHRHFVAAIAMVLMFGASQARAATTIKVKNRSAGPVSVGIDILGAGTLHQFNVLGGRFINPGNSKNYKVTPGQHTVDLIVALKPVFPPVSVPVDVRKKKTVTLIYHNGTLTVE